MALKPFSSLSVMGCDVAVISAVGRWRQQDKEFKVIFVYVVNLRPD